MQSATQTFEEALRSRPADESESLYRLLGVSREAFREALRAGCNGGPRTIGVAAVGGAGRQACAIRAGARGRRVAGVGARRAALHAVASRLTDGSFPTAAHPSPQLKTHTYLFDGEPNPDSKAASVEGGGKAEEEDDDDDDDDEEEVRQPSPLTAAPPRSACARRRSP